MASTSPDFEPRQQPLQPDDVHRLVQAVVDGLAGQRVVGNLALADQVFGAGDLVGKHRRDEVLGVHPRQLRRHLPAAAHARQRQRDAGDPAPARGEHRRVEHRLDQHRADVVGVEVANDVAELEAVRGGQRQQDMVLGRRRLQLEVELAAEALAQRQPPGAVDAPAIGRMDDELHAAGFVEEALEGDLLLRRQRAERRLRGGEIFDDLLGGGRADPRRRQPRQRRLAGGIVLQQRAEGGAQPRHRPR